MDGKGSKSPKTKGIFVGAFVSPTNVCKDKMARFRIDKPYYKEWIYLVVMVV